MANSDFNTALKLLQARAIRLFMEEREWRRRERLERLRSRPTTDQDDTGRRD